MEVHGSPDDCVTSHPGFHPACLYMYVLKIAHHQYIQQYNETIQVSAEMCRYTAYLQLARWAGGYLGNKIRVVLPSCAVTHKRNTFPSESGNYTVSNQVIKCKIWLILPRIVSLYTFLYSFPIIPKTIQMLKILTIVLYKHAVF